MSLEGKWINELGSQMELRLGDKGSLTGTYLSSKAGNDKDTEPLSGRARDGESKTYVGWAVCYSDSEEPDNDPSVCAWSGVYSNTEEGEQIDTTWLLTSLTDEPVQWDSTTIGKNLFRRPDGGK